MNLVRQVFLAVALAAVAGAGASLADSSALELLIQKAHSLEGRGRYDLAAQTWQQVLTANPDEAEALAALARISKRAGRNEEAQAYMDRLKKIDPHNVAINDVQSLKPVSDDRSRLAEALRLAAGQHPDQAMKIYHEVFGDDPPPGGWAIAYYETQANLPGGWEKATASLQRLSNAYPAVQEYKFSLGKLLTYRPATRQSGLALLESVQGSTSEQARQAWRQALIWEKANPAVLPSMRAYLTRYDDADIRAAVQTLSSEARRPEGNRSPTEGREGQRGYEALKAGEMPEAQKHFEAVLEENPNSAGALAGMGFLRLKQQDFAGAAQFFEKAHKINPNDKDVKEGLETAQFWKYMKDGSKALHAGETALSISSFTAALALRPNSPDALQALAGTFMKQKNAAEALPLYEKLVQLQPVNPDLWRQLVDAKFTAGGPDAGVTALHAIPDSVMLKLNRNPDFVALSGSIYAAANQDILAQNALKQVLSLVSDGTDEPSEALQVQIAGLMLRYKKAEAATERMLKVTKDDPGNLDAWQVLLAALVQEHKERKAADLLPQIPEAVYSNGLTRRGFVTSVAAIDAANGKLAEAEGLLVKLIDSEKGKNSPEAAGAQLQLANVYIKQGHTDKAQDLLDSLTESYPENADVWKAYTSFLHEKHQDADAIALRQRMPAKVSTRLMGDYDYISALAAAETAAGNSEGARRLLYESISRARSATEVAPVDLQLQLAWLVLDSPDSQSELFSMLEQFGSRRDLTPSESAQVTDLWATWMLRTAEAANAAGDLQRAVSVLTLGCRMMPKDDRLKRSLAGYLLKAGDTRRALNVYENWGLKGATAADYAGAIGAAMDQQDKTSATAWLREGLARWPANPQLLDLAGKQSAAAGDYKNAKLYWREALKSLPQSDSSEPPLAALAPGTNATSPQQLRALMLGNDAQTTNSTANTLDPQASAAPHASEIASLLGDPDGAADGASQLVSYHTPAGSDPTAAPANTQKFSNSLVAPVVPQSPADNIQDQLASITGRNSPYLGTGDTIQGRSGQAGFDRMVLEQANMEASTTIGDEVRVTVAARPTFVDSGSGAGVGNEQFGTLKAGSLVATQAASGVAADAQISSQTFGLDFGSTPRGFLVHNLIGGLRFTPAKGPITFLLDREAIQDSLLAFAGTRDPGTNIVWGGVVANTVSIRGNWGTDRSGVYASAGYQWITGDNVERNTRLDGNFGTYWKVYRRKEGALTVGLNVSAMHYDKDLRYFTLGQGGYFSPQQYFLFSVPFRWTGNYKQRLQYTIAGSLGSQHFEEDASPYFPTMASLQGAAGLYYPGRATTGANYGIEARIAYQIAPNWFIGSFANGNNARDYSSQSAGIFVRYSFEPRSQVEDNYVPSVPDWKGQQPFHLF